jgi:RNA polymerase sigma factor (sigma-70 family)
VRELAGASIARLLAALSSPDRGRVEAAAELLTERFLPAILRACRECLPIQDVGDAVDAAAERLFARLKSGAAVQAPGGLARKIARGECSRLLRERQPDIQLMPGEEDERELVDLVHARDRLRAISSKVSPSERVILRDTILDRPSAETAAELGKTVGAIDVTRLRLRHSLRPMFDE